MNTIVNAEHIPEPAGGAAIFALSSAPGRAAIAVVRVSGRDLAARLAGFGIGNVVPRYAKLCRLRDPGTADLIDEALVLYFSAPNSETGEDVVELQVHGGRAVIARLLEALGSLPGFRPAEPGEFARRAFANGKLDLTTAEGIADLVDADTEFQRRQALRQATGGLAQLYRQWREQILEAMALTEAAIDFSDEGDVAGEALSLAQERADGLRNQIIAHLDGANRGEIVREGYRVVLAGPPNAGKSTLMNALARRDVAIVTDIPGTTRDVLEVRLDLGGMAVVVSDTAGMRETVDAIEQEGIRRARDAMARADLVLWLVPPDRASAVDPGEQPAGACVVRIATKADVGPPPDDVPFAVSARTGEGLEELTDLIARRAQAAAAGPAPDDPVPTNARHRHHLERAVQSLERARRHDEATAELAAEDLRLAAGELGRLTGAVDAEEVLGAIFGRFCIGK